MVSRQGKSFTKEKRIEAFGPKNIINKDNVLKSMCYGATGFVLLYILYKLFEKKK